MFQRVSYTLFMDSNIKVEIINVDQKKDHPAMEYFRFWEIGSFPAAVFVSPMGRSMVLPISVSDGAFEESVWSSLGDIISSPKRDNILKHIVRAYSVVLIVEGKDADENRRVYDVVTSVNKNITRGMSQLPKRIEEPPHVVVIPQEKISQEKILLWSLGMDEEERNEPFVAVLYGRGRRIGPVLKGNQITGRSLLTILSVIGMSCECGLDRTWTMGLLLPLRWDKEKQSEVVKYLGFDAENPMVKREMSSILSLSDTKEGVDRETIESIRDIFGDYSEEILKVEKEPSRTRVSPARLQELVSPEAADSASGLNMKIILYVMSFIVVLILAGGLFILLRSRRRKS